MYPFALHPRICCCIASGKDLKFSFAGASITESPVSSQAFDSLSGKSLLDIEPNNGLLMLYFLYAFLLCKSAL